MKKVSALCASIASLALVVVVGGCSSANSNEETPGTSQAALSGSYARSCSSCYWTGRVLECICDEGNGSQLITKLDTTYCPSSDDISNVYGCLDCTHAGHEDVRGQWLCTSFDCNSAWNPCP